MTTAHLPPPSEPDPVLPDPRLLSSARSLAVVGQATGVLMEVRGCAADEALALLTGAGRAQGRTLEDVAAELVAATSPART